LAELQIVGTKDLAHPAVTELRHDSKAIGDQRAGREAGRAGVGGE